MFYMQGEVISDQFYHLKFILFGDSVVHFGKKTRSFGNFSLFQWTAPQCIVEIRWWQTWKEPRAQWWAQLLEAPSGRRTSTKSTKSTSTKRTRLPKVPIGPQPTKSTRVPKVPRGPDCQKYQQDLNQNQQEDLKLNQKAASLLTVTRVSDMIGGMG